MSRHSNAVLEARYVELLRRVERLDHETQALEAMQPRLEAASATLTGLNELMAARFVTFRTLVDSQAEKVALALASADKAVVKAEASTERRFESVNEFRATLADQQAGFISRSEATSKIDGLATRMEAAAGSLGERIDRNAHDIDLLASRIDRTEGRTRGINASWGYLVGAIGFIATMLTIVTTIIILTR